MPTAEARSYQLSAASSQQKMPGSAGVLAGNTFKIGVAIAGQIRHISRFRGHSEKAAGETPALPGAAFAGGSNRWMTSQAPGTGMSQEISPDRATQLRGPIGARYTRSIADS